MALFNTVEKVRTEIVNRMQRRHPGTRRQRSYHGAGQYSVVFFDKTTGLKVGDYNLPDVSSADQQLNTFWRAGE